MRMRSLLSPPWSAMYSLACRLRCNSIHHILACNGTQSKGATRQGQDGVPAELPPPPAGASSLRDGNLSLQASNGLCSHTGHVMRRFAGACARE